MPYVRGHLPDGDGGWVTPRYRTSRRALLGGIAVAAAVPLLLGIGAALRHVGPAARPAGQSAAPSGPAADSATLSVYVEPHAGLPPVYRIIAAARHTVRVAMYELNDPAAEHALAAAARRRVDVVVLLDQNRERSRNQAAFSYLHAHGVRVAWANPHYPASHEKAVTADGRVAAIMTGNLVSRDYPSTRDVLVVDRDRADVAAIDATVAADLARRPVTPPTGADLVWSPTTSQASLLSLLGQARHTLAIENEELDDPEITRALLAALRRHVQVTLVLPSDPRWESALVQLQAAGARVVELGDTAGTLYIHAKVIAADAGTGTARLFVGSQNFTLVSLRANRELAIILRARPLVHAIAAVVQADATASGR